MYESTGHGFTKVSILIVTMIIVLPLLFFFLKTRTGEQMGERTRNWWLVCVPALWYSLFLLLWLQTSGAISFDFFGTKKSINNTLIESFAIVVIYFCFEVMGNVRFVREKEAEIISYAGRRSGESAREGPTPVPGILPLMVQVVLYLFLRFSFFGNTNRKISTSPLLFNEAILAYSNDNKAFLVFVGCHFNIVDPYLFDDALDDTQGNEDAKRAPVIARVKEAVAHSLCSRFARYPMASMKEQLPSWKVFHVEADLREGVSVYGLSPVSLTNRFLRFDDAGLQSVFQSHAGADIRRGDINEKVREVTALLEALRALDPAYTAGDAERMWETMTKRGRGSYKFSFL